MRRQTRHDAFPVGHRRPLVYRLAGLLGTEPDNLSLVLILGGAAAFWFSLDAAFVPGIAIGAVVCLVGGVINLAS